MRLVCSISMFGSAMSAGLLLGDCALAQAPQARSDTVAMANCLIFGEGSAFASPYRLGAVDLEHALAATSIVAVTAADADTFRHYIAYPERCVADEAVVKARLGQYLVSEALSGLSQLSKTSITAGDLDKGLADQDCMQVQTAMDRPRSRQGRGLIRLQERFEAWMAEHPLLGKLARSDVETEELKWRAYFVGRALLESQQEEGVEAYVHAFSSMRAADSSAPGPVSGIPPFYFVRPSHFPEEMRALFGTVSAADHQPIGFASHVARQGLWHFVMTGQVLRDDSPIEMDSGTARVIPEIDVTAYLRGVRPAPDACLMIMNQCTRHGSYEDLIYRYYNGILEGIPAKHKAILDRMIADQIAEHRDMQRGSKSFGELVSSVLFSNTDPTECTGDLIEAQFITDIFDEHGALLQSQVVSRTIDNTDLKYDYRVSGPHWSSAFMSARHSDQPLSEPQRRDILSGKVFEGRFSSYFGAVKVHQIDTCEMEQLAGSRGSSVDVPRHTILQSRLVTGNWREQ